MKTRKIPMRSCVITRERLPKNELIRVVRTPEGKIMIDHTGKVNGHGAYLKKELQVFEKAKKGNALGHYLKTEIPEVIFEELKELVK